MKQPIPMMQAPFEGPHCPTCHCGWFRTSSASGPLSKWIRECKHCGTQYSTDESLMLVRVMEGEANYEAHMRHKQSGMIQTYERATEGSINAVVTDRLDHGYELIGGLAGIVERRKPNVVEVR